MINGFTPLKYIPKKPEPYKGSIEIASTNAPFGRSWRFRQSGRGVDIEIAGAKRFFGAKYSIILECNDNGLRASVRGHMRF